MKKFSNTQKLLFFSLIIPLLIMLILWGIFAYRHHHLSGSGTPASPVPKPSVTELPLVNTTPPQTSIPDIAPTHAPTPTPAPTPEPEQKIADLSEGESVWIDIEMDVPGYTTNHSVQSMAIGTVNDCPLLLLALSDGFSTGGGILALYDLRDMTLLHSISNQEIGHCNGVTFCPMDQLFYIACGGGDNSIKQIVAYNSSLELCRLISFEGISIGSPYGIAYDYEQNRFLTANSGRKLIEFDYDFNVTRDCDLIVPDDNYVTQSLYREGELATQIHVASGKVNSLLYKYRWTADELTFDSAEFIDVSKELEAGYIYGGQRYLLFIGWNRVQIRIENFAE